MVIKLKEQIKKSQFSSFKNRKKKKKNRNGSCRFCSDDLNKGRDTLINRTNYKILAVINVNQITNYPPGNKTSWRRPNDVVPYVPVTSQVRLK